MVRVCYRYLEVLEIPLSEILKVRASCRYLESRGFDSRWGLGFSLAFLCCNGSLIFLSDIHIKLHISRSHTPQDNSRNSFSPPPPPCRGLCVAGRKKKKARVPPRTFYFSIIAIFYRDTQREFWFNRVTFAFSDCTGYTRKKSVAFCDRFATGKPVTVSWESLKKRYLLMN